MASPAFFGFTPATKQFLPLAYSLALVGVELAGLAGDALGDDLGVFVDQDGHVRAPSYLTAATIFLRRFGHGVGA